MVKWQKKSGLKTVRFSCFLPMERSLLIIVWSSYGFFISDVRRLTLLQAVSDRRILEEVLEKCCILWGKGYGIVSDQCERNRDLQAKMECVFD